MPGLNGMEAAGEIRRTDDKVCIIFVTNMVQFAVKGYDVGAMSYMVKPIEYFAFSVQFKKAIAHTNLKNSQDYVYLHTKEFSKKIFLNDLYMIEVIDHSLTYHTKDGDYNGWGQISKAEDELISKHFFRCNKCYLVNLQHVHEVTGLTAKVGNKELLVSRRRKREFLQALNEYLGWSDD